jgi:hypothetical protein
VGFFNRKTLLKRLLSLQSSQYENQI